MQEGREGAGKLLAPAVGERDRRLRVGVEDRGASFSSHLPQRHGQDLPWDRRDPRDQQHLGLQKDPEEEARVDGYSFTSSTEGCSALARAQGSLRDCGDPKGATSSSTASYGGAECWGPKNNTYGWSGKTLQTGEATVALQPSLSSLSCLTLVTARPLGTLEGEKGPCQAAGGRPPPNAPQDPVHHTRDAPAGPAPLTGMPRAPAGPEGPIGPCAPWGEKRTESKGSMGCWGGALRCQGCPNQPCYLQAALLAAPGIGSCRRRTASLNTLSWSVCTE